MVRLQPGSSVDTMRLGNNATPKRNVNAAIVQDEETNAYSGLRWEMARGMLATASTFSTTTIQAHGIA